MDNRGQSIGISQFFLSLAVGAIVVWLTWRIGNPVLNKSMNATTNSTANQGTTWLQTGIDNFPTFFLGISFFGLIAYAVYRREVTR